MGRRDYAILLLLAKLGLRADEVATLTSMISTGAPARYSFAPRADSVHGCRYRQTLARPPFWRQLPAVVVDLTTEACHLSIELRDCLNGFLRSKIGRLPGRSIGMQDQSLSFLPTWAGQCADSSLAEVQCAEICSDRDLSLLIEIHEYAIHRDRQARGLRRYLGVGPTNQCSFD